jgi:hypothetical protein
MFRVGRMVVEPWFVMGVNRLMKGVPMGLLRRLAAVTAAALLPITGLAGTTSAKGSGPPPNPLASGLVGPLGIAVTARGDVLVAQSFIGTISKVDKRGGVTDLVSEEAFAPGVADDGDVLYTSSGPAGVFLKSVAPDGTTSVVADIGDHEINQNPDADQQYGFTEISDDCAAEWPEEFFGPPQYTGIIDTNPYAIATTKDHIYIADAAANAILSVDALGDVTTVAVLPPQPAVVDEAAIDGLGLPDCTLGLTYNFEPVPTDVELHGGQLYVTTLPGGPEDPSAGARGGVWTVDPRTGEATQIGAGLAGATDLAVSPSGTVYVTELFSGQVTRVGPAGNTTVAVLDAPVAIEWAKGRLYVAAGDAVASPFDPLAAGQIITIRP